ncbi:MAG: hypothetical protein MUF30_13170 [Burkholderiales bacterium]|nr:hypothetical protein [Gemmatimonadaceae bacterium]MCU0870523.1 hypothetical protein [Burkholderiales bacterium]
MIRHRAALLCVALYLAAPVGRALPAQALASSSGSAPSGPKAEKGGKKDTKDKDKAAPDESSTSPRAPSARALARTAARAALFADSTPLAITLRFDHRALFRDRDTLTTKWYPARLIVRAADGTDTPPVRLRPRGHFRLARANCDFVPLLIDFAAKSARGTTFDGQRTLKLVTHCQTDQSSYDELLLREHLVYRVHNLLTPHSFQSRLVAAEYGDSADAKWHVARRAMLVEHEDLVARRAGGKIVTQRGAVWENLDSAAVAHYALFQYLIGGTDWSVSALHNVRIALRPDGTYLPLAYDFDWTGLVDAPYSVPDPRLNLRNTRQRLFRGPCWPPAAYRDAVQHFVAQRDAIARLFEHPDLSESYRRETAKWLAEFYRDVADDKALERTIKRSCDVGT